MSQTWIYYLSSILRQVCIILAVQLLNVSVFPFFFRCNIFTGINDVAGSSDGSKASADTNFSLLLSKFHRFMKSIHHRQMCSPNRRGLIETCAWLLREDHLDLFTFVTNIRIHRNESVEYLLSNPRRTEFYYEFQRCHSRKTIFVLRRYWYEQISSWYIGCMISRRRCSIGERSLGAGGCD